MIPEERRDEWTVAGGFPMGLAPWAAYYLWAPGHITWGAR